jgi:hypothetical protein
MEKWIEVWLVSNSNIDKELSVNVVLMRENIQTTEYEEDNSIITVY